MDELLRLVTPTLIEGAGEDQEFKQIERIGNFEIVLEIANSDQNEEKITLFATTIWGGSRILCSYLLERADLIVDANILEFGAGAGLPSIVAAKLRANRVCASDYPSTEVIETLQRNFHNNSIAQGVVVPHIWGSSVDSLISSNNNEAFDVIIAAECLWRHECHDVLLDSILSCLKPSGTVIIVYSHHIPGLEKEDDGFPVKAETRGLMLEERRMVLGPCQWRQETSKEHYICCFKFRPQA